ncbi:hypothetical protein RvY_11366 [Ramazzottius varieornatus]|uniref:G-patch domain-containing protein n=1 Tax=Ramazzottius varieornatus TaxID=947166 RepID=A0A1D1VK91_RAMVA|nr:hypothetical protein RvY_11366 [Ramazzottius varieornatus]
MGDRESELPQEDFVVYGTAVEQLADDETVSSKPVPIHEQTVTDEKGRQRFHGAFTGGFSAGYFNTVGSIEGWAPRTFQSSRQSKAEARRQRPEDYMDNEDFGDYGIAPKKISTKESFASSKLGDDQRRYGVTGPPDKLLRDLIVPLTESYGVVLLKKMGWKPGQGIGPRITFREKHKSLVKEGKASTLSEREICEKDELAAGKLFAPEDVTPLAMTPKTNFHGIGYRGLAVPTGLLSSHTAGSSASRFSLFDEPVSSTALAVPTARHKSKKAKGMSGQAFGVGAFEDEDDDVYSMDDLSRYDRVLGGTDEVKNRGKAVPLKAIQEGGRKVIEGFEKSERKLSSMRIFPPPNIPRGFTGERGLLTSLPPKIQTVPEETSGTRYTKHDAKTRENILNEEENRSTNKEKEAPREIKTVFDLIPTNQRSRLPVFQKAETLVETLPVVSNVKEKEKEAKAAGVASVEEQRKQHVSMLAGMSATLDGKTTFKPFEKDPKKQKRYEMFLQRRNNQSREAMEEVWMETGTNLTEWDREQEKFEFLRAAALYKPMNGLMAARFTSEKGEKETNEVEVSVDSGAVSKERKAAVEKKLYGKLTRDVFEWHPDRLVSKRFNVPHPYPNSTMVGILKVKKDKYSMFNFINVPEDAVPGISEALSSALQPTSKIPEVRTTAEKKVDRTPEQRPVKGPEKTEVTPASKPTLPVVKGPSLPPPLAPSLPPKTMEEVPAERPPMDLFRAIFESSDVEDAAEDVEDASLVPSIARPTEEVKDLPPDPIRDLFEVDRRARALEKMTFPTKPEVPVSLGPERPPPEVLAALAEAMKTKQGKEEESDSGDVTRSRKKRKKEKTDRSEKKHKKKSKKQKKDKRRESYGSSSAEDDRKRRKTTADDVITFRPKLASSKAEKVPVVTRNTVTNAAKPSFADDESASDVEEEVLMRKLKRAAATRRLTAADFM